MTVGSVPGGSVSRQVVSAAAEAGIKILFTSKPVSRSIVSTDARSWQYAVQDGYSAHAAAALAAGKPLPCASRWVSWNSRKVARRVLGQRYYRMRTRLLRLRVGHRA